MARILKVQRQSGAEEAFDEKRIIDSIVQASQAVGPADREVARELAGVVTLFLEKRGASPTIHTSEIEDMVERVLLETGHVEMARAYIRQRHRTSAASAKPPPEPRQDGLFPGSGLSVLSADGESLSMWDRQRVAQALVREADLDPELADAIAQAVEARILRRSAETVTTSVIRSLVDAELFDRGLSGDIPRQAVLGMPAHDVKELVRAPGRATGAAPTPASVVRRLGRQAFRQFALSEVYSAATADAHARGAIHVHGLASPLHLWDVFLTAEYVKRFGAFPFTHGRRAEGPESLAELAADLTRLAAGLEEFFASGVDFGYLNLALAPLADRVADDGMEEVARLFWDAIISVHNPEEGYRVHADLLAGVPDLLRFTETRGPGGRRTGRGVGEFWTAAERFTRALAACATASSGPGLPAPDLSVHVDANTFRNPSALSLLRFLCRCVGPGFTPTFVFERESSWMHLHSRHLTKVYDSELFRTLELMRVPVVQCVSVNAVQPALAAGPGKVDAFCSGLEAALSAALTALDEKRVLLAQLVEAGLYEVLERPGPDAHPFLDPTLGVYTLSLTGLRQALQVLCASPEPEDSETFKTALSAVSYLELQTREEARKQAMPLQWGDDRAGGACSRFAALDRRAYPQGTEILQGAEYDLGLGVSAPSPAELLGLVKDLGSRYALVESRMDVFGLTDDPESPPEGFFDLVCEAFESTDLVFLRFR